MNKETVMGLEEQFRTLKNVRNAHVDLDENEEVVAIGIFSDGTRHPKDVKRDVEEVFRQVAGYRINHTKISIVEQQFDKGIITDDNRIRFLTAYQIQKSHRIIEGFVQLEYNDNVIVESVEAHQFEMDLEYLIANATTKAIMKVIDDYSIRVDHVREVSMGQVDVIIVTLTVIHTLSGAGNIFVGSVVKTKDLLSSVAKATLDALNRRMDQLM